MRPTPILASACAAFATFAVTAVACAQTAAPAAPATPTKAAADTIDPKAKTIYDGAVSAAKKMKSFGYTCEMTVKPGMGEGNPYVLTQPARVLLEFGSDDMTPLNRFRIESLKDGKPTQVITFDGTKTVMMDVATKSYTEGDTNWFRLVGPLGAALPQWCGSHRMGGGQDDMQPKLVSATVTGEETIDGTPCDVVLAVRELTVPGDDSEGEATPQKVRFEETLAIARTDGIPRRIGQLTKMVGPGGMEAADPTMTFTAVKADPALEPTQFVAVIPEGFAKKELPKEEEHEAPRLAVKVGDAAPDFKLMDLQGKEVTLASLSGKVFLLDFWATWCGPCVAAMPIMQKISEEYKDKGALVIGVNTWERKEGAAKKFMEAKKYTYGCLLSGDELAKTCGVPGIPTLIIVGKDGKVVMAEVGSPQDGGKALRAAIDAALAAKS
jgi:thiol-disulfide isomerase/thioredoxin